MPFQIIRNDITRIEADAIVNTANPRPRIGAGTDSAIYRAAGKEELLKARMTIGEIAPGQAAFTKAYGLKAKYIIHTVGPAWEGGNCMEREILHSCYEKTLHLAAELGCGSIAFPLIATGSYGFPRGEALQIALEEFGRFLLTHEMDIILAVFDVDSFELSGRLMGNIREYIDEHYVRETKKQEYPESFIQSRRRNYTGRLFRKEALHEDSALFEDDMERPSAVPRPHAMQAPSAPVPGGSAFPDYSKKSLDEMLRSREDTFQQRLFKLIDESGLDDVTVYKRANIDRKVFSRIRCNTDYTPKKKTAVAFAIALHLDMPAMLDLLSRAEIAFSPSSKFDLIITYFVTNKIYDIYEINCALFKYGQPTLG
ncbi:MAG: macro domain-containing protein [bacterium]